MMEKAVEIDASAGYALWTYGVALRFDGAIFESIAVFERLVESSKGKVASYIALLGGALAAAGERAKAEELLAGLERRRQEGDFVPSFDFAVVHAALGDHDAALTALERGREERNALLWGRIYFPDFVALRSHPRWQTLARQLGRTARFVGPV